MTPCTGSVDGRIDSPEMGTVDAPRASERPPG